MWVTKKVMFNLKVAKTLERPWISWCSRAVAASSVKCLLILEITGRTV